MVIANPMQIIAKNKLVNNIQIFPAAAKVKNNPAALSVNNDEKTFK